MSPPRIPVATYRLQFHRDFTFEHARELIPYLHELGVSHCYASPYLKARPGSRHGYDIVDHSVINPELGNATDYDNFVAALTAHNMGQILDIVPNHMGVGGSDNPWWLDVLENGPASVYADYFDIDWSFARHRLRGKIILPLLGDAYGTVLEKGLLKLAFDPERGEFSVFYYDHRFPIDPRTYVMVLQRQLNALNHHTVLPALRELLGDFESLPLTSETMPQRRAERQRRKEAAKARLATLYRETPELQQLVHEAVTACNGRVGDEASFDALHELLEHQPYRLAYWRVAADEINYRRFFDINTLAALRMERLEVFEATHWLVMELVANGKVHGLRLDHPDGLYDPAQYYALLQHMIAERIGASTLPAVYTVTEKILGAREELPTTWRVHGTTGYEFAALIDGVLIQPAGREPLTRLYESFIGYGINVDDLLYENKKLIMRSMLSAELMVLANRLDRISERNRHTRDYTLHTLREALMEFIACLPVYRTYITAAGMSEQDRRYVDAALGDARRRSQAVDTSVFDFLRNVLHLEAFDIRSALHAHCADFVMKLQQYCAPVMAKGLEDTTLYVYNRLVSLNEVGADPRRFGISLAEFHDANRKRQKHWPHALLSTSTHDTKRSEDVRARLNVLTEIPDEWAQRVQRWRTLNDRHRQPERNGNAPSRNDEYLLYQTLIGAWPVEELKPERHKSFTERIEAAMLKAVREAKVNTSWFNQNKEYEDALVDFTRKLLASGDNPFLEEFIPFQRRIARLGMFNSLSQTLFKLSAPGVPDIYQGNELWDFSLVDPDNRRPVDYTRRRELLAELKALSPFRAENDNDGLAQMLNTLEDGRAKLYLIWRTLWLRKRWPDIFASGDYQALATTGTRAECLCNFARCDANLAVIAVAPRWFSQLTTASSSLPLGDTAWVDTRLEGVAPHEHYINVLTGETVAAHALDGQRWMSAANVLRRFPVALLVAGRNVSALSL